MCILGHIRIISCFFPGVFFFTPLTIESRLCQESQMYTYHWNKEKEQEPGNELENRTRLATGLNIN